MSIGEDELEVGFPNEGDEEEMDISFDDAPPQDKAAVVAKAVKAVKPKPAAAPKAAVTPKPKVARTTVAKTAATPAKSRKQHRVDTIDNNKLAAYLDRIVNDEGYQLLSVSGSTSIMGSFTIVSVKG